MDKYYYMVSQLPMLQFDKEPAIDGEKFLEEAEKWLSGRDYRVLSQIDMREARVSRTGPACWRAYRVFEQRFRNDLAMWRRSTRGGDEVRFLSFPLSLVREGDPLEVEKKLLKHRWDFVDAMEGEHHFDLEFLILYAIKLQILERLSRFNKEKGAEIFGDVVGAEYWDGEAANEPASEAGNED